MKRFIAVLAGLLTLPAFAEIAPIVYEEVVEYEEDFSGDESNTPVVTVTQNAKTNSALRAASRAVPAGSAPVAPARRAVARNVSNDRATRKATVRARTTAAQPVSTVAPVTTRVTHSAIPASGQIKTTRQSMTSGSSVARSAVTTADTVNNPIYSGNPVGRVATRVSAGASGAIRARVPTSGATGTGTTVSAVEGAVMSIDELAQLTDFCKAQYVQCMDNFCNVLDDEQGRCSCSANIKNYEKTSNGLKEAQAKLESVYRDIMLVAENLNPDEIAAMFSETTAEAEMADASDSSSLYKEIQRVNSMLVDVESGRASSSSSTVSSDSAFGIDFKSFISGDSSVLSYDFTSAFNTATTRSSSNSISNQRGAQLYKTANARCKSAVLNDCQAQGVDISVVANSYDLEIDKQCIVYERSLSDANDEMINRINNAEYILKVARLYVAKSKNEWSLRDCVTEMDNCMQDEFVCGADYDACLDPTGKYIVNGEVVLGSMPSAVGSTSGGVYDTWAYSGIANMTTCTGGNCNAWSDGSLNEYITGYMSSGSSDLSRMVPFLIDKIGTIDANGKAKGMCAYVMNHCQDYTYENGGYNNNNRVIKDYLSRTLTQIKARQDAILSEYAESCSDDVVRCLSDNGFVGASSGYSAASGIDTVALKACQSYIKTCSSVVGNDCAADTSVGCAQWANELYHNL